MKRGLRQISRSGPTTRLLLLFLAVWAVFSLAIFPIYVFQRTPTVHDFLLLNRFTLAQFRALDQLKPMRVLSFLLLFVPRTFFLYYLIGVFDKRAQLAKREIPPSWDLAATAYLLCLFFTFIGYPPAVITCGLLYGYVLGKLGRASKNLMLPLIFLPIPLITFDMGRGFTLLILMAFVFGQGAVGKLRQIGLLTLCAAGLAYLTAQKFHSNEVLISNPFNRISVMNQFQLFLWDQRSLLSPHRPVTFDLFAAMPIIRNFVYQLDENALFSIFTGGSVGGLSVSPEMRSLAYWGSLAPSIADLTLMYGILGAIISFLMRRTGWGLEVFLITFLLLLPFDSINSAPTVLQVFVLMQALRIVLSYIVGNRPRLDFQVNR